MARNAIYPGTFDPVTNGHLDIIKRSADMYDHLVVAVAEDNRKQTLFNTQERVEIMRACVADIPNVEVEAFSGLLVRYAKLKDITVLIRGLRALSDFDYEFQMALMNKHMAPEIETVFLMTSEKYLYVSSSNVRDLAKLHADVAPYVPPVVVEELCKKYQNK